MGKVRKIWFRLWNRLLRVKNDRVVKRIVIERGFSWAEYKRMRNLPLAPIKPIEYIANLRGKWITR
jgi:hypothetical protein